jgi:hypothetical protein
VVERKVEVEILRSKKTIEDESATKLVLIKKKVQLFVLPLLETFIAKDFQLREFLVLRLPKGYRGLNIGCKPKNEDFP